MAQFPKEENSKMKLLDFSCLLEWWHWLATFFGANGLRDQDRLEIKQHAVINLKIPERKFLSKGNRAMIYALLNCKLTNSNALEINSTATAKNLRPHQLVKAR